MRGARRSLSWLVLCSMLTLGVAAAPAWGAPANDTFATAEEVLVPSSTGPVDTTGATSDADDAEVAAACDYGGPPSSTVWYRFTATQDALVKVDASTADHLVVGAVLTGAPGSFAPVSCFWASTTVSVQAGTEYSIVLADGSYAGGDGGVLTLVLSTGEPATGSFVVTRGSVAKRTGAVTLHGTMTCTDGASAYLHGELRQPVGRFATIAGSVEHYLECTGAAQPWTATVRPYSGKFAGGKASLDYDLSFYNEFGGSWDAGSRIVRLRPK